MLACCGECSAETTAERQAAETATVVRRTECSAVNIRRCRLCTGGTRRRRSAINSQRMLYKSDFDDVRLFDPTTNALKTNSIITSAANSAVERYVFDSV